jgi:bidirectional [NiFe] hydrogenase diaphorase subunit
MLRAELQSLAEKELERQKEFKCRVLCCASTACLSSGGQEVRKAIQDELKAAGLVKEVQVVATGCKGLCSRGPVLEVTAPGQEHVLYADLTPESARQVVKQHLVGGQPLADYQLDAHSPFFTKQVRVVLSNSGLIDPERIEEYIAHDGYAALAHALREMTPEEVCETITRSGLRGRGGAGYPTGLKWNLVRKADGPTKYVIANGDEGDPGAYMDRTLMESDPHRVLEGMAIAAYAVGAEQGFIYVRGEYPLAVKRLDKAIKQAERQGLLGSRIFDSNFNFRVDIRIGAGAFVCGEETALMNSVMGRRGEPRPRPPYPAQSGLWGCPTLINNVETFGNIAPIIHNGPEWYAAMGTEKSKGTKIFALTGNVKNTGLIEVPMGITLREIVYEIGGGMANGRQFKAAQTGGPSGGCIPAEHLDTPVDYESLQRLGSMMGSGGLIVMDDQTSMVDVAKFYMEFCMDESCGKCVPCRAGTAQMYQMLNKILAGQATEADLARLEELCQMVKALSLCGLGQSAPNPILSTLKYFRAEYEARLKRPAAHSVNGKEAA